MIQTMQRPHYEEQAARSPPNRSEEIHKSYYPSSGLSHSSDRQQANYPRTYKYEKGNGTVGSNQNRVRDDKDKLINDYVIETRREANRRKDRSPPTNHQYSSESLPSSLSRFTPGSGERSSYSRRSEDSRRPRKIQMYCNGDRHFTAKQIYVNPSRYGNLDDLLADLTGKMPQSTLPYGVRQIYTPTGGRKIEDVSQLKDGQSYVCAGFEKFKRLNYGQDPFENQGSGVIPRQRQSYKPVSEPDRLDNEEQPSKIPKPLYPRYTVRPPRRTNLRGQRSNGGQSYPSRSYPVTSPYHKDAARSRPTIVTVVNASPVRSQENGRKVQSHQSVKIVLNQRSVRSSDQLMNDVSDALQSAPRLKHLYTTNGTEVKTLNDIFNSDEVFIGTIDENLPSTSEIRQIYEDIFPDSRVYVERLTKKWNKSQGDRRPQNLKNNNRAKNALQSRDSVDGNSTEMPSTTDHSRVMNGDRPSSNEYNNRNRMSRSVDSMNHAGNHDAINGRHGNNDVMNESSDQTPRGGSVPGGKRYRGTERTSPTDVDDRWRDDPSPSRNRAYKLGERRKKDIRLKPIQKKLSSRVTFTDDVEVHYDVRKSPLRQISERQPTPIPIQGQNTSSDIDTGMEEENPRIPVTTSPFSSRTTKGRNSNSPPHGDIHTRVDESTNRLVLPPITNKHDPYGLEDLGETDYRTENKSPLGDLDELDEGMDRVNIEGIKEADSRSQGRPSSVASLSAGISRSRPQSGRLSVRSASRRSRRQSVIYKTYLERQVSSAGHILQRYELGKILGDGNFAVVKIATDKKDQSKEFALKVIDKAKLRGKEAMIENEIEIMKECRHPNIVRLIEEYETQTEIYLVMELIKGGDLFDTITQNTRFSEYQASGMVSDVASALFYLHSRNIVHRDLKPENVMVSNNADGSLTLKLADFGLAMEVTGDIYTVCGTPTYVAPEILTETGYGLEIDMWALGVILYILLCGFPPFRSADRRQSELFSFIKAGQFEFLQPYWDDSSDSVRDLISRLLVVNRYERFTAIDTLSHPFITTRAGFVSLPEDPEVFQKHKQKELEQEAQKALKDYQQRKKLVTKSSST